MAMSPLSRERRACCPHHRSQEEITAIAPSEPWKQHLASLAGFDQATLVSLADAFVTEVPQLCHALRLAIGAEDQEAALRITHSLRASFRCVDPTGQAESTVQQVEIRVESDRFTEASQRLSAVEETADQWCLRVAALLPKKKPFVESLCRSCALHREVRSATGSTFLLCRHGLTDRTWPKYPPQPVLQCRHFQPFDLTAGECPTTGNE